MHVHSRQGAHPLALLRRRVRIARQALGFKLRQQAQCGLHLPSLPPLLLQAVAAARHGAGE